MSNAAATEIAEAPRECLAQAWHLAAHGSPVRAYAMALRLHEAAQRQGDYAALADSADCLADCCIRTARYELGIGFSRTAHALWQARGLDSRAAGALSRMAEMLGDIGEPEAVACADQALALAELAGNATETIRALMSNGVVLSILRQPSDALPFAERAVALSRQTGIVFPVAIINLAEVIVLAALQARQDGDEAALRPRVVRALELTWEARTLAHRVGDGWLERLALNNVAEYSMHIGDTVSASAAVAQFDAVGGEATERCRSHHLLVRGQILAAEGRCAEAVSTFDACLEALRGTESLSFAVLCHLGRAEAQERLGLYAQALTTYRTYHRTYVQQASDLAQRRARIYARRREAEELQQAAARAEMLAADLAANNAALAREAERLLRASHEDPLTGLSNRRVLELEFRELAATGTDFAAAMLDIDHFKQVNDSFSHAVGDSVLRTVARLLADHIRRGDLVVRFGGEEFALIMRETSAPHAQALCERLRKAIQDHDWATVQPGLSVTTSIGVARSDEAEGHEAVLQLADARLYKAKSDGRNRVVGAA